MSMLRLPADEHWVGRLAELADGPWTTEAVAAAFLRFGWVEPTQDHVEGYGACLLPEGWVQLWFGWADGEVAPGWNVFLAEYPPDEAELPQEPDEHSELRLGIAYFWPPQGEDDDRPLAERLAGPEEWQEFGATQDAEWIADPAARRADFHAEYERVGSLIRARCGEPTLVVESAEHDGRREIWSRGTMALVLVRGSDEMAYDAWDMISLLVTPSATAGKAH